MNPPVSFAFERSRSDITARAEASRNVKINATLSWVFILRNCG